MRILVTGATGYIGEAAAAAMRSAGHQLAGLARSEDAAAKLSRAGFTPVKGDFADPDSLGGAAGQADVIVSTASIGSLGGDADTFRRDRDAVRAMLAALDGSGKTLIFTSGSAVVGVFGDGEASARVYDEDVALPLAEAEFAPPTARTPALFVAGFGAAMAARIETEQEVAGAAGIRGVVIRPGLVYGASGSYDLPRLIALARRRGVAPHLGSGETLQSFVHIDDLADLFRLAVERARPGAVLHGVSDEVRLRDVAAAISRMIGAGDRTERLDLAQMFGMAGSVGVSLAVNKRLSAEKTRRITGWAPTRTDILHDLEFGSYAG
jgi:nucleoside-diphosphate-sugar epimerase